MSLTALLLLALTHSAEPAPPPASEARGPIAPAASTLAEPRVEPAVALVDDDVIDGEWHGSFSLGANYVTGNTEVRSISTTADATRRREGDRTTARGWWYYSEQRPIGQTGSDARELNDRRAGVTGQYDYYLTERTYALGTSGVDTDQAADIELRYFAGAGAGYQFVENVTVDFKGDAALTYFSRETSTEEDEYAAIRASYALEWAMRENILFNQIAEAFPSLEDSDQFYSKLDSKIRVDLTENFFAQLQWVWDFNNVPAEDAERSDHRVTLGVGWGF